MHHIDKMMEQFEENLDNYEQYAHYLEMLLMTLLEDNKIDYHSIIGRTKNATSLRSKLIKGAHKYRRLADVTDVIGLRIITHFASDVSLIAALIEKEFVIDDENSVDKRKQMEVNQFGYMSFHYVVSLHHKKIKLTENERFSNMKVEIQIRSMLQHAWAEIEHDLGYKLEKQVPWDVRRAFSRVSSLLETADLEFDRIRKRMEEDKEELLAAIRTNPTLVAVNKESIELYTKIPDGGGKYTRYLQLPPIDDIDSSYYHHLYNILDFMKIKNIGMLEKKLEANKEKMRDFMSLLQINLYHFAELLCLFLVSREKSPEYMQYYYKHFMFEQLSTNDMMELFTIIDSIEKKE